MAPANICCVQPCIYPLRCCGFVLHLNLFCQTIRATEWYYLQSQEMHIYSFPFLCALLKLLADPLLETNLQLHTEFLKLSGEGQVCVRTLPFALARGLSDYFCLSVRAFSSSVLVNGRGHVGVTGKFNTIANGKSS